MVKTLIRSSLREIRQSLGRYLAILAIVGLGVGFFSGLRACQPDMMATGVAYLEEQNFYDFRLLSTLGFTEDDVAAFAAADHVSAARGGVYTDFLTQLEKDGAEVVVTAYSLTEDINLPRLQTGRLPQAPNECLGDAKYMPESLVGTELPVCAENDQDTRELLAYDSYTVVGLAWFPTYLNYERGTSSLGNGSVTGVVYIPENGFDFDAYYEIYLTMTDLGEMYSEEYDQNKDLQKSALEKLLEDRAALRFKDIYDEALEKIGDAQQEVTDGWEDYYRERADVEQELNDAYRELTDGESDYEQGQIDYEQGQIDYEQGRKDYAEGQQKVLDAQQELADAQKEVEDGERELADARLELDDGWTEYYQGKADAEQELADALKKLEDGEKEYQDGLRDYQDGLADYEDGVRELDEAEEKLADAEKKIRDGERELAPAEAELDAAWRQLQSAKAELDENQATLDALGKQLADGEAEIEAAQSQLDEARQGIEAAVAGGQMSAEDAAVEKAKLDATQAVLDGKKAELQAGRTQYEGYKAQLDQGWAQYQAGYEDYRDGEAQVDAARKELRDGKAELEKGQKELSEGRIELADAKKQLDSAQEQLTDARKELDDGWAEYNDGKAEADQELADALAKLEDGEKEYADGVRELEDGKQRLADGERELADAQQELRDAQRKLNDARDELDRAPGELADARQELDDGWAEYNDGKAEADQEFADAEKELQDAEIELADAKEDLKDLKRATTYVLTRSENTGYACFESDTSIVAAISVVFPVFFFLVAALVCMTTMTRMVDEQRTQIGILKALGYGNGQIMTKYLFYSGSAAVLGSVFGFELGVTGLPWVIWEIFGMIYGFAPLRRVAHPVLMGVSFAAALLCSVGATWLSCRRELKRQASELIRPKTPKAGKRVLLEYITPLWRHLSFLRKVSVRNVLRYRSRLIMMVLGIGGCTALLCTGFGIRDSIAHVADDQFDEITLYDYSVTFQDNQSQESAAAYLEKYGWNLDGGLLVHSGSVDVQTEGGSKSVYLVISASSSFDGFLDLHNDFGHIEYPGRNEVVITSGLAETLGINVGDNVWLRVGQLGTMDATVSALCDNYVYNYAYISAETYREQLLEEPEYNTLFVLAHEDADPYEEGAMLLEDEDVSTVLVNAATRDRVDHMLSRLDYIVLVVVLCAAALAFIVLYNLTNININERIREIATIKVLGFHQNEVAAYVFREINILSALGSFVGLGMGKALHAFVMNQIQVDSMSFACRISPVSYLSSFAMTILFTVLISTGMRPRLKNIDMAESLKSIE